MSSFFLKVFERPYWITCLILGSLSLFLSGVTLDEKYGVHISSPEVFFYTGIGLIILSAITFGLTLYFGPDDAKSKPANIKNKAKNFEREIGDCKLKIEFGKLQDFVQLDGSEAVVLPCNEYYDDKCANDPKGVMGAYVNTFFNGNSEGFISFVEKSCKEQLPALGMMQKTAQVEAMSFSPGTCVFMPKPLGHAVPMVLVATTTQREGEGLVARSSYVIDGVRNMIKHLVDERIDKILMPLLGSGHGGLPSTLALNTLLLAISETLRSETKVRTIREIRIVIYKNEKGERDVNEENVCKALDLATF